MEQCTQLLAMRLSGLRQLYATLRNSAGLASVLHHASSRRAFFVASALLAHSVVQRLSQQLESSLLDLNAGRRLGTTSLRSGALLHNAHNMPTARSKALAARAGRSFIDPVKQTLPSERAKAQEEGLVTVWREEDEDGETVGQPRALVVLDKNGQWRPARSLYEYVQQNVIEICAAKIHHDEHGDPPSYENNYSDGWEDATEVYAKPVGLKTSGGIDSLLRSIMIKHVQGLRLFYKFSIQFSRSIFPQSEE